MRRRQPPDIRAKIMVTDVEVDGQDYRLEIHINDR